jgi:hypothetical protein
MLSLVACSFSTIDSKLDETLSNLIEPDKTALGQEVEDFHVVSEGINIEKGDINL